MTASHDGWSAISYVAHTLGGRGVESLRTVVEVYGPMDDTTVKGNECPAGILLDQLGLPARYAASIRTAEFKPTQRLLTRGSRYATGYDPEADPVARGRCVEAFVTLPYRT